MKISLKKSIRKLNFVFSKPKNKKFHSTIEAFRNISKDHRQFRIESKKSKTSKNIKIEKKIQERKKLLKISKNSHFTFSFEEFFKTPKKKKND